MGIKAKSPRVPWQERNRYYTDKGRVSVPGMVARVVDTVSVESLAAIQRYLLAHESRAAADDVLKGLSK